MSLIVSMVRMDYQLLTENHSRSVPIVKLLILYHLDRGHNTLYMYA